jgi:DNA-binding response OmpR family regulator
MKILLVDDEIEFVSTLAERLSLRGIKADEVTNGKDAIDKVNHETYDVIVLDLRMVGLDGFETMKQIQKIRQNIEFIIISGHCCDEEYDKMINAGASDFLVKPINIEDLVERINKIGNRKDKTDDR